MRIIEAYDEYNRWYEPSHSDFLSRVMINRKEREDIEDIFIKILDKYDGNDSVKIKIDNLKSRQRGYMQYYIKVDINLSIDELVKSELESEFKSNSKYLNYLLGTTYNTRFTYRKKGDFLDVGIIVLIDNSQLYL